MLFLYIDDSKLPRMSETTPLPNPVEDSAAEHSLSEYESFAEWVLSFLHFRFFLFK